MLALCAASIALHYLTLAWVVAHLGQPNSTPPKAAAPVLVAQLRLALPAPIAALDATPPAPARPVRAKPVPRPAPKPIAASAAPAEVEPAMTPAAEGGAAGAPAPAEEISAATQDSAAAQASAAAQSAPAPPEPPAPPPVRRYKVNAPPSAAFALDVRRVDADGSTWSGAGEMTWRLDGGGNYTLSVEAGLDLLITRVNLLVLTSAGTLDDNGIAPVTATEKRKGRSLTATHFDRAGQRITFSASATAYPLLPGAQDKATLPFQLAGIGRADVNQFQGDIDVFVGEDKEANVFRFTLVGEDELETKMGRLVTWHLSRPPKPGSYSSRLEIWLAPSRGWYPVQIRNTETNGAVTTQSVSSITVTESTER